MKYEGVLQMKKHVALFKCSLFIGAKFLVTRMCCIVYSCETQDSWQYSTCYFFFI